MTTSSHDQVMSYVLTIGGLALCIAIPCGLYLEWRDRADRRLRRQQRQQKRQQLRKKGGR